LYELYDGMAKRSLVYRFLQTRFDSLWMLSYYYFHHRKAYSHSFHSESTNTSKTFVRNH
jgi:hypothetical protein